MSYRTRISPRATRCPTTPGSAAMNAPFAANAAALSGLRVSLTSWANRSSFADSCAGLVDTPIRTLRVFPHPVAGPHRGVELVTAGVDSRGPVQGTAAVTVPRHDCVPGVVGAGAHRLVEELAALVAAAGLVGLPLERRHLILIGPELHELREPDPTGGAVVERGLFERAPVTH